MKLLPCRIFSFALFLLVIVSVPAGATEQWITTKIFAIYPLSNGDFVITFHENHPSCTAPQPRQYFNVSVGQNGVTEQGRQALLAVSLAAAASKAEVQVAFDDSSQSCYINRIWAEIGN